jgi:hypothetical protein
MLFLFFEIILLPSSLYLCRAQIQASPGRVRHFLLVRNAKNVLPNPYPDVYTVLVVGQHQLCGGGG